MNLAYLKQVEGVSELNFSELRRIYVEFSEEDARRVKEIEKETNHDVKAVEYFIKEKPRGEEGGGTHLALQMIGHHLLQSTVEPLTVFVKDHGVGIPVQLLERQPGVVLSLDFLKQYFSINTIFQNRAEFSYLPE